MHRWDLSPAAAIALQRKLAPRVIRRGDVPEHKVRFVAGADVAFDAAHGRAMGVVVVLTWPELDVAEQVSVATPVRFPYVPGLLSFRETPALLPAFARLEHAPQLVLADGHGYSHPRRFGFACHLGLVLGIPTVGVAKSRLVGAHGRLGARRGSRAAVMDAGEVVGVALRTRDRVRPVYVSVGHRVSLDAAEHWTLACVRGRRLPEPARLADALSRQRKRELLDGTVEMVIEQRAGEPGRWEWLAEEDAIVFRHDLDPMPLHYGAIPGIVNPADGELLDVHLVGTQHYERGERVMVQVVDMLERRDGDHKLLAVPLSGADRLEGARRRVWSWYVKHEKPVVRWTGEVAAVTLLRTLKDGRA